jgi:tetratricopeptide (TPR) repeat protein
MTRIFLLFLVGLLSSHFVWAQGSNEEILRQGNEELNRGNLEEARKIYESVLKRSPKNHVALNNIGITYYYQEDSGNAERFFKQSLAIEPNYVKALANLGKLYYESERQEESLTLINKALGIEKDYDLALYVKGRILGEQGDIQNALQHFSQAIKADPEYSSAYYWRGYYYTLSEKYQLAILDYTKVTQLSPDEDMAFNNRGYCYMVTEEYDKALTDLEKAISINAKNADAINNRAFIYHTQGKTDLACTEWQKAIGLGSVGARNLYQKHCIKLVMTLNGKVFEHQAELSAQKKEVLTITGLRPMSEVEIVYTKSKGARLGVVNFSTTSSSTYQNNANKEGIFQMPLDKTIEIDGSVDVRIRVTRSNGEEAMRMLRIKLR